MNTKSCKYSCEICTKFYSSSNSLWNHNKKYHNTIIDKSPNTSVKSLLETDKCPKTYPCKVCNKIYYNKNSRWSHKQKCKMVVTS